MTWVKICGITNLEDALVAVEAGADAVGFVFHEKSPRKVDVETVRAIVAELPERVEKVGVFVEQNSNEIRGIVERAGLSVVQLHSANGLVDVGSWRIDGIKSVVAIASEHLLEGEVVIAGNFASDLYALLVDSRSKEMPGGTGRRFDWQEARTAIRELSEVAPVAVAGGLNHENVAEAIGVLKPWGVDVASGVEARPGKKDPEKVRAFVKAVREADRKVS